LENSKPISPFVLEIAGGVSSFFTHENTVVTKRAKNTVLYNFIR
jgi:hypothetical protein